MKQLSIPNEFSNEYNFHNYTLIYIPFLGDILTEEIFFISEIFEFDDIPDRYFDIHLKSGSEYRFTFKTEWKAREVRKVIYDKVMNFYAT